MGESNKKGTMYLTAAQIILLDLLKQGVCSVSKLKEDTKLTYCHVSNIVSSLTEKGLVKTEKKGRVVEVTLTEDGLKRVEGLSIFAGGMF